MDQRLHGEFTHDMCAASQTAAAEKVMGVLDEINARRRRGTLRTGGVQIDPDWTMRWDLMSRSYTMRLDHSWVVRLIELPS